MAGAFTGIGTPSTSGTSGTFGNLFGGPFGFPFGKSAQPTCVFGRVNLLVFIAGGGVSAAIFPPISGGVVAQVTTFGGATIPLVQTRPTTFGTALSTVDNQFAVVCGTPTRTSTGQLALDVSAVLPLNALQGSGGLGALPGLSGLGGLGSPGGLTGLGGAFGI